MSGLLTVDVGNTSVVLGLHDDTGAMLYRWRIRTVREWLPDNYAVTLRSLFELSGLPAPSSAVVSSVAPPVGHNMAVALRHYWQMVVLEVSSETLSWVSVEIDEPRTVGADRLLNTVGAQPYLTEQEYGIVVDFGTATTFDVVARGNRFLGGAIAPGPATSADALFEKTAKLPRVSLIAPARAIGRNTTEALQSGLVLGYAELIDGMIRRISAELPSAPVVMATGGFAATLEGICHNIHYYDEDLTLKGLLDIWREAKSSYGFRLEC